MADDIEKEDLKKQTCKNMSIDVSKFTVKEGEAEILMQAKNEVFYNKTQVNNRDISISVLRTFLSKRKQEHESLLSRRKKTVSNITKEPICETEASIISDPEATIDSVDGKSNGPCEVSEVISHDQPRSIVNESLQIHEGKVQGELKPPRVLEALSASGLRAIRYAREVEGIGQVVALDNDKESVEACRRNLKFNGSLASSKVDSQLADARVYMLTHPKEFDMVDLDPYGSPSVFLDSAVQSIVDGGMLMCTATDMAVLCGGNGEVCYSKYGSYPLRAKYCHEMALRILLACIEIGRCYEEYPSQALIFISALVAIRSIFSQSEELCPSVRYLPGFGPVVPQECSDCGKKINMAGPIWSAPIHDQEWVSSILEDVKSMKHRYPAYNRISAVLTTISEELPDVPLFLSLHNLCTTLKCTSPSAVIFCSAVINAGYRISGTHVNPLGLKSDAPMNVIWDISCVAGPILLEVLLHLARHWGPKLRAGRTITSKHVSLLGPQAINGTSNQEEGNEPRAKRKKAEDSTPTL
ncbi:hypothetical protein AgCh_012386 [Apium graveolens]